MKNSVKSISFAICIALCLNVTGQKKYQATWESIDSRPIPGWFTDAKFGIFIHWGVFSVPSWGPVTGNVYDKYAEWYWYRQSPQGQPFQSFVDFHNKVYGEKTQYQDFVKAFKAEMFDPDKWADIIKQSGAKYVVLTSKHHEGFTLWPSAQSWNWNSVDLGPHRDLAGDLSKSVKAKGLHMGFYYSLYEWFNPLYRESTSRYVDEHMIPQLKDLVTRYNPDLIFADGEWDHPSDIWKSTEFLAWLYNDSPVKENVVVNDRWGKETRSKHGGYYTTEYDLVNDASAAGVKINHPWEECRGIGGSFGYNRNENLEQYETSESLVHILIDKVARGGNFLLNIGPTADGRIPVIMQQRLKDIGDWLAINGESIYATTTWVKAPPVTKTSKIYYTAKGNDLYAIVTAWQDQPILIDGVGNASEVVMLGYQGKIRYSLSGSKIKIFPPFVTPATNPCQYAWVFKIKDGAK
jgi:alpha-L-fucosidase